MKRRYIVISSFFSAILVLGLFCYAGTLYKGTVCGKKADADMGNCIISVAVSGTEDRAISTTRYVVEVYNADSEELVREERTMPAEFAGMTRKEIEDCIADYKETMQKEGAEEDLESISLIRFSREELVLRKVYREPEKNSGFYLRFTDEDEVAVYKRDGKTLLEKTGIYRKNVPAEDLRRLENGFVVENEKELYSILENFSS